MYFSDRRRAGRSRIWCGEYDSRNNSRARSSTLLRWLCASQSDGASGSHLRWPWAAVYVHWLRVRGLRPSALRAAREHVPLPWHMHIGSALLASWPLLCKCGPARRDALFNGSRAGNVHKWCVRSCGRSRVECSGGQVPDWVWTHRDKRAGRVQLHSWRFRQA